MYWSHTNQSMSFLSPNGAVIGMCDRNACQWLSVRCVTKVCIAFDYTHVAAFACVRNWVHKQISYFTKSGHGRERTFNMCSKTLNNRLQTLCIGKRQREVHSNDAKSGKLVMNYEHIETLLNAPMRHQKYVKVIMPPGHPRASVLDWLDCHHSGWHHSELDRLQ